MFGTTNGGDPHSAYGVSECSEQWTGQRLAGVEKKFEELDQPPAWSRHTTKSNHPLPQLHVSGPSQAGKR
jgi:hypothetical protein